MKYLELTFDDPGRNLACDEALLDWCEERKSEGILRIWQPSNYFVVLGYSNKFATEVNVNICAERKIPILRRFTGGGTVLQGPGCLNYSLVVKHQQGGNWQDVTQVYALVLERHRDLVADLTSEPVRIEGTSDLAIQGRKFSGNAQHRKHAYTLVHGSFLLNFELALLEICLPMPSRQPAYRQGRPHGSFLKNLLRDPADLAQSLRKAWHADEKLLEVPLGNIEELVNRRYSRADWNSRF